MLKFITLREINRIFAITDPMGISREALMIPLPTKSPGSVRRLSNGKIEIVVDAQVDFDEWLLDLEQKLKNI